MKHAIIRNTIIITAIALIVVIISSMLLLDYSNKKTAEDNIKKLTAVFLQEYNKNYIPTVPTDIANDTRLTVIKSDGEVIFDSMESNINMGNHLDRPEIISALNGTPKIEIRYSNTLNKDMIYYAQKAENGNIVRVAIPLAGVTAFMTTTTIILALVLLVVFIAAILLSSALTKSIIVPISNINKELRNINSGTFTKLQNSQYTEINEAISGVNEVAEQLSQTMKSLENEKNKLYFVLDSMQEGMVAIDNKNEIVLINRYASGLFNVGKMTGKAITFITDNKQIVDNFRFESADKVLKTELNSRWFSCRISKLSDNSLSVMMLSDITEETQMTKVKTSFFESASHELKTPITSIKGFTELLQNDNSLSQPSKKYIEIMTKDIDRLLAIIDDMLSLSKLENSEIERHPEKLSLKAIAEEIAERYIAQARLKDIAITISGESKVEFDKVGLQEILSNLVDNAIKYNKEKGKVEIIIEKNTLIVKDSGIGIEQKQLARIFERFYRVEKGRSRASGGTGLGLAIVKHVAIANNAQVSVKSQIGIGTEFIVKFS